MARTIAARTWRETTPEEIEHTLADLWRELAQQEHVARAVMSNLVVFRARTGGQIGDPVALVEDIPLDEVVARHPSRVILLDHDARDDHAREPISSSVAVVTFGPDHARYAVEQIAVQSACAVRSLPSIVRRLVRGDVPTSIWWAEDISSIPPIAEIAALGRQLVYDSRPWRDIKRGVLALTPFITREPPMDLCDLNWRRLAPIRHALQHASATANAETLRGAPRVRVLHRRGDAAIAWLAVGWLSARLGWVPAANAAVAEAHHDDDDILTVFVGEGSSEVTVTMNGHRVLVTYRSGAAPFTVAVPRERDADAVAAELRNLSHDTCLDETLIALAERFSAATSS